MFTITRLNHMVLYVRDARASLAFYQGVLGFKPTAGRPTGASSCARTAATTITTLRCSTSEPTPLARRAASTSGCITLPWRSRDRRPGRGAREAMAAGALVGETDHGASFSLYGHDPDGNEFEVFWPVPREEWDRKPTT